MVNTRKKDGKRKRITEGDSVKDLKKFALVRKGNNVGDKSSKKDNMLVIHGGKKATEVQLESDFDVPVIKIVGEVHSQKIIPTEKILKERNRNFNGKIIYWCDMEVPGIIMKKLNQSQLDKFKTSCFGNFLDFGEHQMYSQIIHHALVREVHQRDNGEMWFLFGEKRIRFGLPEFCLISGLRWQGEDDISAYKGMKNLLVEKFFGDEAVTRSSIGRVYREAVFDDDDEAVRMSMIMLVFNFILSTVSDNYVDGAMINFLCFGDVSSYPWGKVAFKQTKYSLSNALKGRLKKGTNGGWIYNFYKEHYTKFYKLNGLSYVFQVFLFETIPTFKARGICNDDHPSDVRLFRWKELVKPPTNDKLNDLVFGSGQLRIKSLIPTVEEKYRLDLGGVHFFNGNDADKKVEKNVNVEDVGFSISDVKDAIDARFRPLEKKVSEIKKDIEKLRADIRNEMEILHIQICRDFRLIIREELCGNKGIGDNDDKEDDGDYDGGSDEDSDSDDAGGDDADDADDDVDEDGDGFKGKENDDDDSDDGSKVDEKNDEYETEAVKEVEHDVMMEEPHADEDDDGNKGKENDYDDDGSKLNENDDVDDGSKVVEKKDRLSIKSLISTAEENDRLDLGGVNFFNGNDADKKVEKNVKEPHADEDDDGNKGKENNDDDDGSKLNENDDGDDGSKVVEKNDENETETVNEVERDVTVEEPHEIKNNDDEENVKIGKNNDMPSLIY